ncbi:MAG TPA: tripartite tricarboxylate transporter substrate binding protein [Burkholderiales bacterium]|jgi:tripartite-type tricarboxylate transporter receptor subunit TctC|nr:tripartite tricarboxylate transporter substrate binding protein [Burkholderiales bacterium]
MSMIRRRFIRSVAAAAALGALAVSQAFAQGYPSKPVKMVVPFPPGGPTDVQARIVAQKLGESFGQPVVIDNRGGAGGMLGSEAVAKSAPDGYTLLMGASGPHAVGVLTRKEPPYDPLKDFTPLSLVSFSPLMLVVHPSVKANSVQELIALAKAQPGKLNYGSFGNGTMAHFAGELFKMQAGIDIVHVPYKGTAPALADLVAGHIPMMFDTVITSLPHVKAGRLRGLAVTKPTRSAAIPELPTVAEAGLPGFQAVSWIGLMGPAGLPKEIVDRISGDMVKMFADAGLRQKLMDAGAEPVGSNAAEFGTHMKAELERWEPVVKAAGLYRKN